MRQGKLFLYLPYFFYFGGGAGNRCNQHLKMRPKLRIWHFIWICCLALGILPTVVSKTPQNTTRLLHELYESTGGGNWNYTSIAKCLEEYGLPSYIGKSWNFTTNAQGAVDPCSEESHFIGLNCTGESIVNGIALPCGGLTGMIPELNAFNQLQYLDLDTNQLTGTIPEFLGQSSYPAPPRFPHIGQERRAHTGE